MKQIFYQTLAQLPPFSKCSSNTVYVLEPQHFSQPFYLERTNRNIGWITDQEQEFISKSVVSIAGCGGMGGLVAAALIRLGVGEIRLADPETFDVSNINRQFAAKKNTVGVNKALATAQELRLITDDSKLVVYPMGICNETADSFVEGATIVCDLIEFWIVWYRILVHERARKQGINVLNCNTVGHRTNLFMYTPEGMTMEEALGITSETSELLKGSAEKGLLKSERDQIMNSMIRAVVPGGIPEYSADLERYSTNDAVRQRLSQQGTASIIAPNPVMAAGFLANHILFQILKDSLITRSITMIPQMPGYLSFDAATMQAEVVTKKWW